MFMVFSIIVNKHEEKKSWTILVRSTTY